MKIKVTDLNKERLDLEYRLGFRAGTQSTRFNIVAAREQGESLEHIYKCIKKKVDNLEYQNV